jgi:hypothetical protein
MNTPSAAVMTCELAAAVLDPDSDLEQVQLASGIEELKRRLELLLGARPEAPPDVSVRERTEAAALAQRRERVAEAGGQLLAAAFSFLGEILPSLPESTPAPEAVAAVRRVFGNGEPARRQSPRRNPAWHGGAGRVGRCAGETRRVSGTLGRCPSSRGSGVVLPVAASFFQRRGTAGEGGWRSGSSG